MDKIDEFGVATRFPVDSIISDDPVRLNSKDIINMSEETVTDASKETKISHRRQKKLLKKQKWLAYKPIKRAIEREKVKKRKAEAKLSNVKLGPSRKSLKKTRMSTSKCKVNVVLDLSFDHLMSNKDLNSCLKQLGFCYGANRRVLNPVQFYVTSFKGEAKEEMEKNEGYTNWDVYFRSESFTEIFKKSDLIYLTSDSDNVISELVDYKIYIIGGLVDHNAHKGLCLKTAEELGISHARLPIAENIDLKTRKVLAINHVFEILVNVSNGMSWKDALLKVIPIRKGISEKCEETQSENMEESAEVHIDVVPEKLEHSTTENSISNSSNS